MVNHAEIDEETVAALIATARQARAQAYAPYSRFAVGAALLAADGTMIAGCNVENVSYPLGLCAERAAVAAAVVGGHRRFRAIAVVGGDGPLSPCGGCRQVLREFGDLWVIGGSAAGTALERWRLSELLPAAFGRERGE